MPRTDEIRQLVIGAPMPPDPKVAVAQGMTSLREAGGG